MKNVWLSLLFYVGALYDGILGIGFLLFSTSLFDLFQVTPPNHVGYVQFPGALLLVFGLMYLQIGRDPVRNRNLIPYGIGLKICYCAVVFWHWFRTGIPGMWKPWAIADIVFGLLFLWAYLYLRPDNSTRTAVS